MKLFKYTLPTKNKSGLKALVISDIHYFSSHDDKKLEKILMELHTNEYDAIFLVGDIIDSANKLINDKNFEDKVLDFISSLGFIAPTYVAYGSHDIGLFNSAKKDKNENEWTNGEIYFYDKILNKIGKYYNIYVDDSKKLKLKDGYTVSIVNPSFEYTYNSPDGDEKILNTEAMDKYAFLKELDSQSINILLCHYPQAIFSLNKFGLLNNVNLSIGGHNHNGVTQLKVIPFEALLNLIGLKNRGLITPGKSIKLSDTKYLRGKIDFDENRSLIINPSITTFADCAGILKKLDGLFYEGASVIEYEPEKTLKKTLSNK